MKPVRGILAGLALATLPGCIGPDCSSTGYIRESRAITLRLVSSIDSFSIRYVSLAYAMGEVPVRELRNDALGDTVVCTFFGLEGRYEDGRLFNRVEVDSAGIRVFHAPMDADRVDYLDSTRNIQVLKKQACSPLDPKFDADSIHLELGGSKKIVFDPSLRE